MTQQGGYVEVNGVRIYCQILGSGPPLLMLHGGAESSSAWAQQIEPFSRHFQLILPDTRGHGRSGDAGGPLSYGEIAADATALLDYLGIERTFLCGWSDGGIVGLHLSVYAPSRIRKQILIGANYHLEGLLPAFREWLRAQIQTDGPIAWNRAAAEAYRGLSPQGPDSWEPFLRKVFRLWLSGPYHTEAELSLIEIPTLLIAGDREEFVSLEHTTSLFNRLPRGALCIFPHADHRVPQTDPDLFNEIALRFLLKEDSYVD